MQIQKKSKNLMSKYGKKPVYLKAETECLDETDTPVRLPRYTQFTIKNIISQNNSPYVLFRTGRHRWKEL